MGETERETADEPTAIVRHGTVVSALWSVPLLAVLIGLYWIYRGILNTGPEITILFPDGSGLSADKSIVQYRGIQVGRVTEVALAKDGEKVRVTVRLDPEAALLAREGSAFWIVKTSPLSLRDFLWSKFVISALPLLLVGITIRLAMIIA